MEILKIDHVQIAMPAGREEDARAFYGRALGIPEVQKPANLAVRGGVWFVRDALKVHIGVDPNFKPATKARIAFEVSDLAGLITQCQSLGYRVTEDGPLENYSRVYIYDPFGNRLEFMDPLS